MEKKDSYKQIIKSTGVVGGTQMLIIIIGILKMKVLAVILGPSGVGIAGIFQTIVDLVKDATGFGINFSGVKNIAEVSITNDGSKISKTITVLRRWALWTGLTGLLLVIVLSDVFSHYSFGSSKYTSSIAFLSIVVLTSSISASQIALLQGLRKINQMAQANLLGTLSGTLISLPLYWKLGMGGIVPGMVLTSLVAMSISWLYARKVKVQKIPMSITDTFKNGLGMAKLGFYIVVNGFVATLSLYIVRLIILTHLKLDSVGHFQAVWTISTVYVNILLHAMLADYFPRLTALKDDNIASNKLINEQLEITLLLGAPMLIGMIIFAPLGLNILYSSAFDNAIPILRWQMAGSFFTLISWPLAVLYLSKNEGIYCVVSETFRQGVYLGFVYFGWRYFGFTGLGIGFFVAGLLNAFFVYFSLKKISNFRFSLTNLKYIFLFSILVFVVLSISLTIEAIFSYLINISLLVIIGVFCVNRLDKLIGIKSIIARKISRKRGDSTSL